MATGRIRISKQSSELFLFLPKRFIYHENLGYHKVNRSNYITDMDGNTTYSLIEHEPQMMKSLIKRFLLVVESTTVTDYGMKSVIHKRNKL